MRQQKGLFAHTVTQKALLIQKSVVPLHRQKETKPQQSELEILRQRITHI